MSYIFSVPPFVFDLAIIVLEIPSNWFDRRTVFLLFTIITSKISRAGRDGPEICHRTIMGTWNYGLACVLQVDEKIQSEKYRCDGE